MNLVEYSRFSSAKAEDIPGWVSLSLWNGAGVIGGFWLLVGGQCMPVVCGSFAVVKICSAIVTWASVACMGLCAITCVATCCIGIVASSVMTWRNPQRDEELG